MNNSLVIQNQSDDPNNNAYDQGKLRNCHNGLSSVIVSCNLKPIAMCYSGKDAHV